MSAASHDTGEPSHDSLGEEGERLAASLLERRGYHIRDVNWRCRRGELDIVAEEGDCVVFVEVKSRGWQTHGRPAEAITLRKRQRLATAAALYAVAHGLQSRAMRFDVVELYRNRVTGQYGCKIIPNAFSPPGDYQVV